MGACWEEGGGGLRLLWEGGRDSWEGGVSGGGRGRGLQEAAGVRTRGGYDNQGSLVTFVAQVMRVPEALVLPRIVWRVYVSLCVD